jgi:hypothetical protein
MTRAFRFPPILVALAALGLAGCSTRGDLVVDEGIGVVALRTACPTVGVPNYTGDVTLFSAPGRTDAGAIDAVASLTNVRSQCSESAERVHTAVTFDVLARRSDARGARRLELPYFVTVVRGGSAVVSKRVGTVAVDFADGQERAQARGQVAAYVDRAEATLPADIRQRLTRKRKAGEEEAAIDPLSEPDVRAALARASFEVLVGFQLDERQLAYNATR